MLGPYERLKITPAQPATDCSRFISYTIEAPAVQGEYRNSYLIRTGIASLR
jgi:hypothetical protein